MPQLITRLLNSEKNKAILVVSFVVVAISIAYFYQGIRLHSNTIDQGIQDEEKSINSVINNIDLYSFSPYEHRVVNLLTTHQKIPKALANQDRELLYSITLPRYKALQRENKYFHI